MTHRFPLKEIARQANLGTATVDRVINNRPHVSPQTRARVEAAIEELKGQEAQLSARGRRLFFDFIVEAPRRFSDEIRQAAEDVLPQIGNAVCRPRFFAQEIMPDEEVTRALARIAKRGSHGVCLKARNTHAIKQAVDELSGAGIPVVTLVTDLTGTGRVGYVGLDNSGAGRTAAYLIARTVGDVPGQVLTTRSHERFLGEEDREAAFAEALAMQCPELEIVGLSGGGGTDFETSRLLSETIDTLMDLRAVYSMGGGNRSILNVLQHYGLQPDIFVAHDLDRENYRLLADEKVDFVLHHDLKEDLRNVFHTFLKHHRLSVPQSKRTVSDVQVITPANVPSLDAPFGK